MDVLSSTMDKKEEILFWMLKSLLFNVPTSIVWQTSLLKSFMLNVMQSAYLNTSTVSSISNFSGKNERQISINSGLNKSLNMNNDSGTPKQFKNSKKNKGANHSGNLAQILEKDISTFNKKETSGIAFSWGQNVEGQLGVIYEGEEDGKVKNDGFNKKLRIGNPKLMLPLKNTIIRSVACGYTHTLAITVNFNVLAWGNNKSRQLGLGSDAPSNVTIPTQIPKFENIIQVINYNITFIYVFNKVSCGHEHSIALSPLGQIFSWGQGEGGLLGHGDLLIQASPKIIEGLRNVPIDSICCGGLHTIALAKNNALYR